MYNAVVFSKTKTVLAFGTFDGLHEGHRFFLGEARKLGERLVISVAQNSVVQKLKGRPPRKPLGERLAELCASGLADEAAPGDAELGNWSAVQKYRPNIVALGYDQTKLEAKLREFIKKEDLPVTLITLPAHKPDTYHSSLLR